MLRGLHVRNLWWYKHWVMNSNYLFIDRINLFGDRCLFQILSLLSKALILSNTLWINRLFPWSSMFKSSRRRVISTRKAKSHIHSLSPNRGNGYSLISTSNWISFLKLYDVTFHTKKCRCVIFGNDGHHCFSMMSASFSKIKLTRLRYNAAARYCRNFFKSKSLKGHTRKWPRFAHPWSKK